MRDIQIILLYCIYSNQDFPFSINSSRLSINLNSMMKEGLINPNNSDIIDGDYILTSRGMEMIFKISIASGEVLHKHRITSL